MADVTESHTSGNLPFDIARLLMIAVLIPPYKSLAGDEKAKAIRSFISETTYYSGFLVVIVLARVWHGLVTRCAPEPYLVSDSRRPASTHNSKANMMIRTKCFTSHRLRSTAKASTGSGMTRSPPRLACESITHPVTVRLCLPVLTPLAGTP